MLNGFLMDKENARKLEYLAVDLIANNTTYFNLYYYLL